MKLLIPTDEDRLESPVCVSFGRTPYFTLYDTESGKAEFIKNPAAEAESGAGVLAAQTAADSGADVLLTIRCGENAAEVLKEAEMKICKATEKTAQENINAFQKGELSALTHFHGGFYGGTQ